VGYEPVREGLGTLVQAQDIIGNNRSKIHLVSTGLVVYRSIRSFHYRIGTRVLTSCLADPKVVKSLAVGYEPVREGLGTLVQAQDIIGNDKNAIAVKFILSPLA
jgi:hypothetical protein